MSIFNGKKYFGRTAIVAGGGILPIIVANILKKKKENPLIIILHGENDYKFKGFDYREIMITDISKLLFYLKKEKIYNIVFAGGIKSRPTIKDIYWNITTLKILPMIFLSFILKKDDSLLQKLINFIESYGFRIIGIQEIAPKILAYPKGTLTKNILEKKDILNICQAKKAALHIGNLDIGQGAISINGKIVAYENINGTDVMLKNIEIMRKNGLIKDIGGVLVKMMKPNQEQRIDLPTIGPTTIYNAYKAGLNGIAIEENKSIILNIKKVINIANKYNIFIEII